MTRAGDTETSSLIDDLVAEYVDAGANAGFEKVAELERRAGTEAPALRRRLAVVQGLRDLKSILNEYDPRSDGLDDDGPDDDGPFPRAFGELELLALLGRGGHSRVYLAREAKLRREVAVKVLDLALEPAEAEAWISSEGCCLAQLRHEGIVQVHQLSEHEGTPFVVMELVRGPSLLEVLAVLRNQPRDLPPERSRWAIAQAQELDSIAARCRLILALARALAYCHREGVVHRDIKPANVLLDERGRPRLIDFGIAQLPDADGAVDSMRQGASTPAYQPPEQVENRRAEAEPAGDLFSLGVVFYELLTLIHPFHRPSKEQTKRAILQATPRPPQAVRREIPLDLSLVVMACLERDRATRYRSMEALVEDLEAFLGHRAVSRRPPTPWGLVQLWIRRNPGLVRAAGVCVAVFVAAWVMLVFLPGRRARDQVVARLDAAERSVEAAPDHAAFHAAFVELERLGDEGRSLDGGLLARWLYPTVSPAQEQAWRRLASARREAFGAEQATAHWTDSLDERERFLRGTAMDWSAAFSTEDRSRPRSVDAHAREDFRVVELPEGSEVWRYDPVTLPHLPRLVPVEFEGSAKLEAGFYRVRAPDGEGSREGDLYVFDFSPRRTIELACLAPWLEPDLRRGGGGDYPLAKGDTEGESTDEKADEVGETLHVPEFRILSRPVTWAEAERVLGADELSDLKLHFRVLLSRGLPGPSLAPEAPAILPRHFALEFAKRTGTRLPTFPELGAAIIEGVVSSAQHEWTSWHHEGHLHEAYYFKPEAVDGSLGPTDMSAFWCDIHYDAVNTLIAFRVVTSAGP